MGWELAWETWLGAPRSMSAQALCFDQLGATKAIGKKFILGRSGHKMDDDPNFYHTWRTEHEKKQQDCQKTYFAFIALWA